MNHADEDAKLNAKYAISIARKLGATIFVLPEDIIEVKSKMVRLLCDPHIYANVSLQRDLDLDLCWYFDGIGQVWSQSLSDCTHIPPFISLSVGNILKSETNGLFFSIGHFILVLVHY
jgi:hypothetical protein